jgi:hypothetical protein
MVAWLINLWRTAAMRCLNCHTVVSQTDRSCLRCGAPLSTPSSQKKKAVTPFFAVAFMVAGAAAYNLLCPPGKAAAERGGFNYDHIFWAAVVGGACALVGGLFDLLLGKEK